jgi:hypothetical protein
MKGIWAILATTILGWATAVQASPLDLKDVPADAKWVAHVDFDAARSSQVVQSFSQQCGTIWPKLREKAATLGQKIGLDQCGDLHGITIYSAKLEPGNGVLIARAKWNSQTLLERAKKASDYTTLKYGNYTIHAFTAHKGSKGSKHAHQVAGTLHKADVLVLASSPDLLKTALDVLDGKATNLVGKPSPLAANVPAGAIVLARAVDLKDSAAAHMHPVLQLLNSFDYAKGEHDGRWFSDLAVTADSKPVAENLGKVFEGFRAWLSLHAHKAPWFVELLKKVQLNVQDNVVTATFQEPAGTIAALMPQACKSIQEHMQMCAKMRRMHCPMMPGPGKAQSPAGCPMMKEMPRAGAATSGKTQK